jgi:nicotinamidase-related amidase
MNASRKTALLVCDLQTKTINRLYNKTNVIYNVNKLLHMRKYLQEQIPLCAVSEFIPHKLGKTDSSISTKNVDMHLTKTTYSMANYILLESLQKHKIDDVIITGMETQWCIASSVYDLAQLKYNIYLPEDAIGNSRNDDYNRYTLQYLQKYANILTTDALICKFLVQYDDDASKQYLQFLKQESIPTLKFDNPMDAPV